MLSDATGISCRPYTNPGRYNHCDLLIYIGALYAGKMLGLTDALKHLPTPARLVVCSVGLADPHDPDNRAHICAALKKQLPLSLFEKAHLFHLRGSIDYRRLDFKHKVMMHMRHRRVFKIPPPDQTVENRAFLETYGKQVAFTDPATLAPIIEYLEPYVNVQENPS